MADDFDRYNSRPQRRSEVRRLRVKRLTVCAMLSALGVTLAYLGSLVELLDLCTAAFCAMLVIPVVIEYEKGYPWGIYAATSVLSLLLLPNKLPAVVYLLFGYYPIVKAYLERMRPLWCRLLKELLYVAVTVAVLLASDLLVGTEVMPPWYHVTVFALAIVTLNIFDVALTRLITLYVMKYRPRISKWMR